MRKLAALLALTATLAAAGADVGFTTGSPSLPSADAPNPPGSIRVPSPLSQPPAVPARRSYDQLVALWKRAGASYGIPWQVLGAINKVESAFGRNMGPSSAGAIGWMQFMPETWMRWGVDADGNGVADPWNPEDAVFAAARYLAAAGGTTDISRAVFAYNHAQWYVDEVLGLARMFGGSSGGGFGAGLTRTIASPQLVFQVDDLARRLADARADVSRAQQAVVRAERRIEPLGWRKLALEQRAGDPNLSDAAFRRLERKVTQVALAQDRAHLEVERRQQELEYAVSALDELKKEQAHASVSPQAATMLSGSSAPVSAGAGNYVFPVGGGPSVVSVAHTHHDYPAADLAAPEGTPVYALTDSIVENAYRDPNGRCGIGFMLKIGNGRRYVYCHLSYLEPDVQPGAALAAGAQVGLIGQTGHATGPHLHLQLSPATAFPQDEPWFRRFAGRAFRWSDAPTPKVPAGTGASGSVSFKSVSGPVIGFTVP